MTGKRDDRYRRRRYVKMHSDSKISFNTTGQTDIGLTEVLISVTDIPHVANSQLKSHFSGDQVSRKAPAEMSLLAIN